jgi:hypothetical protein
MWKEWPGPASLISWAASSYNWGQSQKMFVWLKKSILYLVDNRNIIKLTVFCCHNFCFLFEKIFRLWETVVRMLYTKQQWYPCSWNKRSRILLHKYTGSCEICQNSETCAILKWRIGSIRIRHLFFHLKWALVFQKKSLKIVHNFLSLYFLMLIKKWTFLRHAEISVRQSCYVNYRYG